MKDEELKTKVTEFLRNYLRQEVLEYYQSDSVIEIDYSDLARFDLGLADFLDSDPGGFLEVFREKVREFDAPVMQDSSPEIRIEKNEDKKLISDLRSDMINNLIVTEGVVKKATQVNPRIRRAAWKCLYCGTITRRRVIDKLQKPKCSNEGCERKHHELLKDESEYVDEQVLMAQERHEDIESSNPKDIKVVLRGRLCGKIKAGDEIRIIGVLDSERRNKKSPVFDKYIRANNLIGVHREFSDVEIDEQEKETIKELGNEPDILDKIINSIAPSIQGLKHIKKGIALQLFGGVRKDLEDGNRIRGDIHTLLVGEPMTGKSQLLEYVGELAPKGRYASGKGTSEAGLTAAAVRDDFSNDKFTLEAGVLPLSDGGVAAIDELDKMDKKDRRSMHQAMEQQRIHINKAGINTTLSSECSILAGANPKHGRFDEFEEAREEIDLDSTLLSRFDLVYLVRDEVDEDRDKRISDQILENHRSGMSSSSDLISQDLLRKYISYARNLEPSLGEEAMQRIQDHYLELREKSEGNRVAIGARQLEALVRLSEASARAHLREEVSESDAETAIKVLMGSLVDFAFDSEQGEFDIDRLSVGTPSSQRERIQRFKSVIREERENGDGIEKKKLREILMDTYGFSTQEFENTYIRLRDDATIYEPSSDKVDIL